MVEVLACEALGQVLIALALGHGDQSGGFEAWYDMMLDNHLIESSMEG
jgi:hypothetical protein